MIKLSYEQQIAFNSLSIIVGNALYALTVVLFLVPSGLITGGATGIALGINRALGLPVSGVLFVINMTMLAVGWVLLGRRFAVTTVASTLLSPLFLALWERVFADFVLTDDLVLNTIFAGFGVGISLGITIRAGASTGGMDIPPLVLNKYFHIPVSASMLVFDMLILCLQAEDEHIEHQHTGRHRDVEIFVQHQRRDVHAAGGCACPDGDAQRNAHAKACKDGVEHQIIGEHKVREHPLPQGQKQGAQKGAGNGGDRKAPPQQHPAHRKHGHVDDEQHTGHRQSQCTVDTQCDAGGTAGDQA